MNFQSLVSIINTYKSFDVRIENVLEIEVTYPTRYIIHCGCSLGRSLIIPNICLVKVISSCVNLEHKCLPEHIEIFNFSKFLAPEGGGGGGLSLCTQCIRSRRCKAVVAASSNEINALPPSPVNFWNLI